MEGLSTILSILLVPGAATAAQANATPEAPLEWVQKGACPFECCRYGAWTARIRFSVASAADPNAKQIGVIPAGSRFQAITGVTHTRGGLFRFTKASDAFKAGDKVKAYDYRGEGVYRVWSGGRMQDAELLVGPYGSQEGPLGVMETKPAQAWWVQVSLPGGRKGWIMVPNPRDIAGADGCAKQ